MQIELLIEWRHIKDAGRLPILPKPKGVRGTFKKVEPRWLPTAAGTMTA
jgi:hypothetical protein